MNNLKVKGMKSRIQTAVMTAIIVAGSVFLPMHRMQVLFLKNGRCDVLTQGHDRKTKSFWLTKTGKRKSVKPQYNRKATINVFFDSPHRLRRQESPFYHCQTM